MGKLLLPIIMTMVPKNYSMIIANNLKHKEFQCRCTNSDCNHTLLNSEFVRAWNGLRMAWNQPLQVNSGFRCQKYNERVGGVSHSRHSMGMAVDVSVYNMDINERTDLIALAKKWFDYVHYYPTFNFIHMHIEPEVKK